ncbi:MAG: hypothetical protein DWQ04_31420 [Chloroflexi bacterium]|nr:MAG: hypothetical protein DWQ04_31420 [Chloroflexota bacterium]
MNNQQLTIELFEPLSELEVLRLVANGRFNRQIADELVLAYRNYDILAPFTGRRH